MIIGLAAADHAKHLYLYSSGQRKSVGGINAYLLEGEKKTIVRSRRTPLGGQPSMVWGSKPTDGGHLNMTRAERDSLLAEEPKAAHFVKRYVGAAELLNGSERFCLWIEDDEVDDAAALPTVASRLEQVAASRRRGSTTAQAMADRPHRFLQRAHAGTSAVVVPGVSSERRDYVPIGYVDGNTVVSNLAYAIYDGEPWLFGLIQSRMHMAWVHAVAGRLESRIRYSAVLVYNTFPVPEVSQGQREGLTEKAIGVLGAREQFPDQTLAELYDPDKMPGGLRQAHAELDEVVDLLYDPRGFASDEDRLARLFEMYEAAVAEEGADA